MLSLALVWFYLVYLVLPCFTRFILGLPGFIGFHFT